VAPIKGSDKAGSRRVDGSFAPRTQEPGASPCRPAWQVVHTTQNPGSSFLPWGVCAGRTFDPCEARTANHRL